uniref:Zinc finger protein Xfin n=1 Tax=Glossina palpalis gambiensis TaxID=67801 RepID=A0A1B0AVI2_9MUSC
MSDNTFCLIKGKPYVCRTCLAVCSLNNVLLTQCLAGVGKPLQNFLQSLFMQSNYSKKMPQNLCNNCNEKLKNANEFIQQIIETNEFYETQLEEKALTGSTNDSFLWEDSLPYSERNLTNNNSEDKGGTVDCLVETVIDIPIDGALKCQQMENDYLQIKKESITENCHHSDLDCIDDDESKEGFIRSNQVEKIPSETVNKDYLAPITKEDDISTDNLNFLPNFSSSTEDEDDEYIPQKPKIRKSTIDKKVKTRKGRPRSQEFSKIKKINDRFLCYMCDKTFSLRKDVTRHVNTIHSDKAHFQCEFCGHQFKRKDKVREHIRAYHQPTQTNTNTSKCIPNGMKSRLNQWKYGDCLYSKPTKRRLIECRLCETRFSNARELRQHLEMHRDSKTLQHLQLRSNVVRQLYPNADTIEKARETIEKEIFLNQWSRFYIILNEHGYEVSISDTENEVDRSDDDEVYEKRYQCELCQLKFSYKYQVFTHMKEQHRETEKEIPYKCKLCKLDFLCSRMFEQHSRTHCRNRDKSFVCIRCPGKFAWIESMRQHNCLHKARFLTGTKDKNNPLKCSICRTTFKTALKLKAHMKIHACIEWSNPQEFRCALCNNHFSKLKQLREHLPVHQDGETDIDFEHSLYMKTFVKLENALDRESVKKAIANDYSKKQLTRFYCALDKNAEEVDVMDSESESEEEQRHFYKCLQCHSEFRRRSSLVEHQTANHAGMSLPFRCDVCSRQFACREILDHHQYRNCLNEYRQQSFRCDICALNFVWPRNLAKHKQMKHSDRGDQNKYGNKLKCDECDKVFIWLKDLKRHRIIHRPDEKKYACPHCERKFYRKDHLLAHIRTHDPNSVPITLNLNRKVNNFDVNLSRPHGYKQIKCMICYSQHTTIQDLRNHLAKHQYTIDFERRKEMEVVDFISAQFYPEEEIMTEATLMARIGIDLTNKHKLERFYSITNENGYELSLDSSETDLDSEDDDERVKLNTKGSYNCDICPHLSFARKYKLFQHHENEHTWEEGRHVCSSCNARFLSPEILEHHYKQQCKNPNKRHQCRKCSLRFMWKDNLKSHFAMMHARETANENEMSRRYECFLCQLKFEHKCELKRHMSLHGDSKDMYLHYCVLCPRMFYVRENLCAHIKEHGIKVTDIDCMESIINSTCWPNGDKVIECKICHRNYPTMANLSEHFQQMHVSAILSGGLENYSIINERGYELHLEWNSETEAEEELTDYLAKNSYICEICNFQCKRKYKMAQHQRSFHSYETLTLKCEYCIFKTVSQKILDDHKASQCLNNEKQYTCSKCSFRFMWPENLNKHVELQHTVKVAVDVTKQEETATAKSSLQSLPLQQNSPKEIKLFKCPDCHRTYNRKDRYNAHLKKYHNPVNGQPLPAVRGKSSKKDASKQVAIKVKQKHLCALCGLALSSASCLAIHMRRHTGERPYKCDICELAFARRTDLISHRRTHTGERPYKCTICAKTFIRSYKLTTHMRTHTGERPYKCTFCDSAFAQSNDLVIHRRRHTGERPYLCDICGDGFIQGSALKAHRRQKGHHVNNTDVHTSKHLPAFPVEF